MAGESVHDGLRVLHASEVIPHVCLIEVNVIDRAPSEASSRIIESPVGSLFPFQYRNRPSVLALSSARVLVNSFKGKTKDADIRPSIETMEKQIVDIERLNKLLELQKSHHEKPINFLENRSLYREFKQSISALEKAGTKVIFYEIPYDPFLDKLDRAYSIRNWIKTEYPQIPFLQPETQHFQSTDGIHLTPYALADVSIQLEKGLSEIIDYEN